jgi:hypothetical protein
MRAQVTTMVQGVLLTKLQVELFTTIFKNESVFLWLKYEFNKIKGKNSICKISLQGDADRTCLET